LAGEQAAQRAAALAGQAQTLRDAIAAMDSARANEATAARHQQPEAAKAALATQAALTRPRIGQSGGGMVSPVAGRVVKYFGAPDADGPTTGITYGVAPGAFVASPCSGSVGFAAPFRCYGKRIIVECAGGYDWVLAGLEQIIVECAGTHRAAGEPIGRMPDFSPGNTGVSGSRPGLYVELRSHGEPVDPMPFLNAKG
jgi:septal ring factor EnvC (AmiA/AmiB activator)